jgi:transmembrane sensor
MTHERLNFLDTAALWHERVDHGNPSAETRAALNSWLNESPEHAAAFRSIEGTWSALVSLAQDPAILEMRQDAARRLTPGVSESYRASRWAAAALIILALGTALWIIVPRTSFELPSFAWLKGEAPGSSARTYTTKKGDRLIFTLDDGSQVTLNTETELSVSFSKKYRTVRLSRGQALFEVAKDSSRPFVVQTKDHRFIAVGTAFDVHIEADQVKVTMLEGTVRAESIEPSSQIQTTVTAGEQLNTYEHAINYVHRVDAERATSWRHGQVIFDNTPLAEAINELNRYSTTHIELTDQKLADLRLSGTFSTGGAHAFVEAVTTYFPIKIGHTDEHSVTLKARE